MAKKEIQVVCKSVFKNSDSALKKNFTKKWIQIINQEEKRKK